MLFCFLGKMLCVLCVLCSTLNNPFLFLRQACPRRNREEAAIAGAASPNTVPTHGYDLGFQGQTGTTELGKYDLGSDDIGHSSRLLSAHNSLVHLREESTTEADYTLDKELKLGQHYDLGYEGGAEVPVRRWASDIDTYLSVSHL